MGARYEFIGPFGGPFLLPSHSPEPWGDERGKSAEKWEKVVEKGEKGSKVVPTA